MQIQAHHPDDLERLRQRSRQQRDRYRAVALALEGHSVPEIAQILARSRRFVQLWVYAYRDHGLDAIVPKRQSGCPSKLPVAVKTNGSSAEREGSVHGHGAMAFGPSATCGAEAWA